MFFQGSRETSLTRAVWKGNMSTPAQNHSLLSQGVFSISCKLLPFHIIPTSFVCNIEHPLDTQLIIANSEFTSRRNWNQLAESISSQLQTDFFCSTLSKHSDQRLTSSVKKIIFFTSRIKFSLVTQLRYQLGQTLKSMLTSVRAIDRKYVYIRKIKLLFRF